MGGRVKRLVEQAISNPPPEALAAVYEGRVLLLDEELDLWLVEGKHGDYIVVRGVYCSCPWFHASLLPGASQKPCYHLIAVELAAREGRVKRLEVDGATLDILMEALLDGFSRTLRRLRLREEYNRGVRRGAADVND